MNNMQKLVSKQQSNPWTQTHQKKYTGCLSVYQKSSTKRRRSSKCRIDDGRQKNELKSQERHAQGEKTTLISQWMIEEREETLDHEKGFGAERLVKVKWEREREKRKSICYFPSKVWARQAIETQTCKRLWESYSKMGCLRRNNGFSHGSDDQEVVCSPSCLVDDLRDDYNDQTPESSHASNLSKGQQTRYIINTDQWGSLLTTLANARREQGKRNTSDVKRRKRDMKFARREGGQR